MKKRLFFNYIFNVILLVLISTIFSTLSMDGVWCHGFSYNIASGLVPYRDFNMVIGPFYSLLISVFIKLFGNYILVFNIANSLIVGIIMTFIYNQLKRQYLYLFLVLGLSETIFGYNTFCAFLVIVIMMIEDSSFKYRSNIIGILVGIVLMTKHNIGICLALVYFLTNKNMIKGLLSMLIPVSFITLYLILNNAFFDYIDFCYLGLGNFLNNFYIDIFGFSLLVIVIFFSLRIYLKTKDKKILYSLAFLIVVFPIIDQGHVTPGLIPSIYYFVLKLNQKNKMYLKLFLLVGFFILRIIIPIFTTTIIFDESFLKYQRIPKNVTNYVKGYSEYIDHHKDKKIYLFLDNAYLIKLYRNKTLNFYDLINEGNLGSDEKKYVDAIDKQCNNKKCVFILDRIYFKKKVIYTQISPLFKEYVLENANYFETLPSGDRVYINY